MIDLKGWTYRYAQRPLGLAIASVVLLQCAYLGYLARTEYLAQLRRIDRVVEAASLGIQQSNRPLVENAIIAGLHESDGARVSLCRGHLAVLEYPPAASDVCGKRVNGVLPWLVRRRAIGDAQYEFVFEMDAMRTFGPAFLLAAITGSLTLLVALILSAARRRFEREVLQPLCQGLDQPAALGIVELEEIRRQIQDHGALRRQQAVSDALINFSAQVAHDIRSPLAVLETASLEMAGIPESQRLLIQGAARHIAEIAETLLSKYPTSTADRRELSQAPHSRRGRTRSQQLAALIDVVAAEKRLQYGSRPGVKIDVRLTEASYRVFGRVEATDFRRVLSNLINNALEALAPQGGTVAIHLASRKNEALVWVQDDGVGIPADVLARLGSPGRSHGKRRGKGLGLAHARRCATNWGGRLELESAPGKGTTATIAIPSTRPPNWFVPEIALSRRESVIVVDDDPTIHHAWDARLRKGLPSGLDIDVVHIYAPDALRAWVASNPEKASTSRYLLDYQFAGRAETGVDLASELDICDRAILVTSAYDEPRVLRECSGRALPVLAKRLTGCVPLSFVDSTPELFDAVLVDDDELVRKLWSGAAESNRKRLQTFGTVAECLARIKSIDKRTPIYLDSELEDSQKGEDLAQILHGMGFLRLFLATGQSPAAFTGMPWITKVVGKRAPWAMRAVPA